MNIPIILCEGSAYEIGRAHGQGARDAIRNNIEFYLDFWNHVAKVDKRRVLADTEQFLPYIESASPELIMELRGVADGAQREFNEILALNCRWELNYAYLPKNCAEGGTAGCTGFAITSEATANGHTFIGQNWDYKAGLKGGCVILKIHQERKPMVVLSSEAGIIGHKGLNSAGIGIAVNFMRCNKDIFQPGLPLLMKARLVLNSESLPQCVKVLTSFQGPNSGNMMIAHRDGEAIDAECLPDRILFMYPSNGILVHTNHFVSSSFREKDTGIALLYDTIIRYNRASRLFEKMRGKLDVESIRGVLVDHFGYPESICRHDRPGADRFESWETITSIIMDLTDNRMLFSAGPPCANPYREISL